MHIAKLSLSLFTLAVGMASAASSYKVTFHSPSIVAGKELKAGEYKMQVDGVNVRIEGEGGSVQTAVKSEQTSKKFSSTTVRYNIADGKNKVEEIRLGGTATRLVFSDTAPVSGN